MTINLENSFSPATVAPTTTTSTAVPEPQPPLAGLRIIDLTQFQSGPMVTLLAGDLGAEVIKIESIQRVDGWRGSGKGEDLWEASPNFNWANRNKKGITLNLTDPRGIDIIKRLIAVADVVVENYTPRVMGNFGLGYEQVRQIRPDIIMLSMPGFGTEGTWRDYSAFAWTTEQMSTMAYLTGYEDSGPLFTSTTGGDPLAGLMGSLALFSALTHRRKTGQGQFINLSQLETATAFFGNAIVAAQLSDAPISRRGNRSPQMAPHDTYPCAGADGWIAIACQNDEQWQHLWALLSPDAKLGGVAPYPTIQERLSRLEQLNALVASWTKGEDAEELMHRLQAAGIAAGTVKNGARLLADRHLVDRGFFLAQDRNNVGIKHYLAEPFRFSHSPMPEPTIAPYLGEHNAEVLSGLLGLEQNELDELSAGKVIGTRPLGM